MSQLFLTSFYQRTPAKNCSDKIFILICPFQVGNTYGFDGRFTQSKLFVNLLQGKSKTRQNLNRAKTGFNEMQTGFD